MDAALERLVWERARGCCEYCLLPQRYTRLAFELDHIVPEKHRGATRASNLALACFACNHHKGPNLAGIDPITGAVVRLFHPRRHSWTRHFRWEGPILQGRTPGGRATIEVLEINVPYRVRLRADLIEEDVFPPD